MHGKRRIQVGSIKAKYLNLKALKEMPFVGMKAAKDIEEYLSYENKIHLFGRHLRYLCPIR